MSKNEDLEKKISTAYVLADLKYFHSAEFIQDLAELGWSLKELPADVVCVKDMEGVINMMPIWPDPCLNFALRFKVEDSSSDEEPPLLLN
ncbi:hypothetical protein UFOVP1_5 [uncultured Caudovirales phage]|uniref:Uncharacterized protein n=1 Tax=uncultured Caudovirales phage TaxID=2100421 RepID=A0A6J5KH97_9CAUD|nr:hypothetical protein UFOVP1_5 [uncultured Caudovirales phage]